MLTSQQATTALHSFPVPHSREEFREAVLEAYAMYARLVFQVSGASYVAHQMFSPPLKDINDLFEVDASWADIGISYESICKTPFAMALEDMYELAYFGISRVSDLSIVSGSDYTTLGKTLLTLAGSDFAVEIDAFRGRGSKELDICLAALDLANARWVLESGKGFIVRQKAGEIEGDDGLTISQMALLSGLSEITVRAAANPKRALRLQTYSTSEGRTRVSRSDAKEWLIAKGRYIPLRFETSSPLDLGRTKFSTPEALANALSSKLASASSDMLEGADRISDRYGFARNNLIPFISSVQNDQAPLRELAELLGINADLLVLRAREVCLLNEIALIQSDIQQTVGNAK